MHIGKYVIGFLIFWFINLVISAVWFIKEFHRYNKQDKKDGIKNDKRIIVKKRGRQIAPRNEK